MQTAGRLYAVAAVAAVATLALAALALALAHRRRAGGDAEHMTLHSPEYLERSKCYDCGAQGPVTPQHWVLSRGAPALFVGM